MRPSSVRKICQERPYRWRSTDRDPTDSPQVKPIVFVSNRGASLTNSNNNIKRPVTAANCYRRLANVQNSSTESSEEEEVKPDSTVPRTNYVPYSVATFRSLHPNKSRPDSAPSNDDDADDTGAPSVSVQGMSVNELPPIGNRPGSGKSRRSSRDSSSGRGSKGGMVRFDKAPLLSVDSTNLVSSENRTTLKRSHISPGSNGSSSPSQQGSGMSAVVGVGTGAGQLSKSKSWCATEANAGTNPRLETLFEQKNFAKPPAHRRLTNGVAPTEHTMPATPSVVVKSKPPRARRKSQDNVLNGSLLTNKRSISSSVNNLMRMSDNSGSQTARASTTNRNGLSRTDSNLQSSIKFKSEQNLFSPRRSPPREDLGRKSQSYRKSDMSFSKIRLQPVLSQPSDDRKETLTTQNLRNIRNATDVTFVVAHDDSRDNDDDDKKDQDHMSSERNSRIVRWLTDVNDAEMPSTPYISEDTPTQTDTAIHIVYDKD